MPAPDAVPTPTGARGPDDAPGVGAGPSTAADLSALSYEQARAELTEVVRRLEAGGTTLEESLALWERGEGLADACQAWLDGARRRLDAVRAERGADGDTAADG